jgi:ATP-binding protein involved in chromosome partitioning
MSSQTIPVTELTADAVRDALRSVPYPGLARDLVSFGMVEHVSACDNRVKVRLTVVTHDPTIKPRLEAAVRDAVLALGAASVAVEIAAPSAAQRTASGRGSDPWADQVKLARVRHVIAVGAGKGGVGKSTVAVNLALALARGGLRTGLLDADIYGPSLPILLGVEDGAARVRMSSEKHIVPIEAWGLPLISFGFFIGEASPAVWRGPMVSKAVKQFARGVAWPELDVLIVDLPPGTGDIPLSLAQSVALSGAIVVAQPPRVAAAEARKAAEMFRTLEVPVLGIVETMTGAFGAGAGETLAAGLGVSLLGAVPFDPVMVAEADAGTPTVAARPESESALAFKQIASRVATALGWEDRADEPADAGE